MRSKSFLSMCTALAMLVALAVQLSSCEAEPAGDGVEAVQEAAEPRLLSLEFLASDNPMQLVGDARCAIVGDSVVDCWVSNIMPDKRLVARFSATGGVALDGAEAVSGQTACDYRHPVRLSVATPGGSRAYTVVVHAFTGLPVLWIETEGGQDVLSKDEYQRATFRLVEDIATGAAGGVAEGALDIRGRGNTTWDMPKKPYRLRLDAKAALLGMPADRSWVLLANYADKTMLRNELAFTMGRMSTLGYTPRTRFVELVLNGRYQGTYQLCEKLKAGTHRVDVGDGGFLLEVDYRATAAGDVAFATPHLEQPVGIREPEGVSEGDADYAYVRDFVTRAEQALFSDAFTDPDHGWQAYMDMDSFADWYVINEIARNTDACLYTSCYMHLARGGRLTMGPLWDFDVSFGNVDYVDGWKTDGLRVRQAAWFARLFEDPAFRARVRERLAYFHGLRDDLVRQLNQQAAYLRHAVRENDARWHTLYTYTWPNHDIWGSYQNEVQSMKEWLTARLDWLTEELQEPPAPAAGPR